MIQTLAPDRAEEPFAHGIGIRRANRCFEDRDVDSGGNHCELRSIFAIVVWDHVLEPFAEGCRLTKLRGDPGISWDSERIRGELLKLDIHVAKRTIQKYIRQVRPRPPSSHHWPTFLHNHAHDIWACDFLPVVNLFFRQYFVFFIVELASRRVVHFGVTVHPTDG
jgi:hypothetical protein